MTIKEAAQLTGLSADTLRYYERIGLIPPVPRNESGIRNYDEESINWVKFIKCMREAGLPVEALIEYVALFRQGPHTVTARKEILTEQREILAEKIATLQETLEKLSWKIANYDQIMKHEIHMSWSKEK